MPPTPRDFPTRFLLAVSFPAVAVILLFCATQSLRADLKEPSRATDEQRRTLQERRQEAEKEAKRKLEEADRLYAESHPVSQEESPWVRGGVVLLVLSVVGLVFSRRGRDRSGPLVVLPVRMAAGGPARRSPHRSHSHRDAGALGAVLSMLKRSPSRRRHRSRRHRHSHD